MPTDQTAPPLWEAKDRAQLTEQLVTLRAQYANFLMRWTIVVTLVWWVTDPILLRGIPGGATAFGLMRVSALVDCIPSDFHEPVGTQRRPLDRGVPPLDEAVLSRRPMSAAHHFGDAVADLESSPLR